MPCGHSAGVCACRPGAGLAASAGLPAQQTRPNKCVNEHTLRDVLESLVGSHDCDGEFAMISRPKPGLDLEMQSKENGGAATKNPQATRRERGGNSQVRKGLSERNIDSKFPVVLLRTPESMKGRGICGCGSTICGDAGEKDLGRWAGIDKKTSGGAEFMVA